MADPRKRQLIQSATCMTVLRKARLVALKEQIRRGAYCIGGKKVADALIRETLLDEMLLRYANVLTIEDAPALWDPLVDRSSGAPTHRVVVVE